MGKYFNKIILKIIGWDADWDSIPDIKKAVVIMAPHTSNWDFFIGRLAFVVQGINVSFLIKKEAFFFPFAGLLKRKGGIPVDRGRKSNIVQQVVDEFNKADELMVVITPEGTRSYVKKWRKGFYHIAMAANVPICVGYMDYKKKIGGIKKIIYPTGDIQKDCKEIVEIYKTVTPRHPEKYNKNPNCK